MKVIWFQISMITLFIVCVLIVTNLSERGILVLFTSLLVLCILLAWIVMIQINAIKYRTGLLWTLFGNIQPIRAK